MAARAARSGIIPGGIRDRAMRAVEARGPQPEDPAKTKASQEYWARYCTERAKRAGGDDDGLSIPPTRRRAAS
jgi:hypothetical protein